MGFGGSYFLRDSSQSIGAASVQLLPASSARSFLLIENVHATQTVWVNLTGGTAAANTAASRILLAAGGGPNSRLLLNAAVPTNAITAIASGASTPVTVLDNGVA
jgi:hypothetical protein